MMPKKSLGQSFLTSEAAIHKIIAAAKISPDETVLEVGPGRGALTKALITAGANVIAVEKDHRLCEELSAKFSAEIGDKAENGRLKIIEGDILEIRPENIGLSEINSKGLGGENYKIVANIPYYITGQFLKKFLSADIPPSDMILLLQKEVVERIIAADKKESLLSISVKAYGQPKKIAIVKRGSFFPAPNVDSAIIAVENISKKFFGQSPKIWSKIVSSEIVSPDFIPPEISSPKISEEKFFDIVRAGFAHKRKMLVSNLAQAVGERLTRDKNLANKKDSELKRGKILKIFADCGISEKIRAENLRLEQWKQIAERIG